ncbi:Sensors of blue-light using FAD [Halopseudomonas xinjiangensis]|uniref:Sensors of blue-light using FAD n=2 Tax=Halopseudomonas xinjiangensis TaxID=487184 RepID=A0A1H1MWF4_9GAMM|nr:Sensors of blue-light using FAD [Halopseudomonas xinjiangensis]
MVMTELVRIVYISRADFRPTTAEDGVDANVAQILAVSRRNNHHSGVVGMLHYGDGCFFQCLEGERSKIAALYRRLRRDGRHHDLKLLVHEPIRRLSFPDWSMKFIPTDDHVRGLLDEHGFSEFDPYRFDHHLVERMLKLMQGSADPTHDDPVFTPSAPARSTTFAHEPPTQAGGPAPSGRWPLIISLLALSLSVLSLLLAIGRSGT